jgi:hypothetical protein
MRILNPFAPGAGTPPPELAGRDVLRETIRVAIERVRRGLPTKGVLLVGCAASEKAVLLDRMRDNAEGTGLHTVRIEALRVAHSLRSSLRSSDRRYCD